MKENRFVTVVGIIVLGLITMFALSMIPTLLWYCFDDRLAEVSGVPELGNLAWYHVYSAVFFVALLVRQGSSAKKAEPRP